MRLRKRVASLEGRVDRLEGLAADVAEIKAELRTLVSLIRELLGAPGRKC